MKDRQFNVLIHTFSYAGNGGFKSERPEVGRYLKRLSLEMSKDKRIANFADHDVSDTPITMTRNAACRDALRGGADFLLMVDSDMEPDYLWSAGDRTAKPFFQEAFNHAVKNYDKGPFVYAAPYCGPPPNESVYVFHWASSASGIANEADVQLSPYTRHQAAMMSGMQPCAAAATGLMLIDCRILDMTSPKRQLEAMLESGMSKHEAEQLIRSWFYYEYTDVFQAEKCGTEDVMFTRDISLWGEKNLGYNPLMCLWDSWAIHWKPHGVGKPQILYADQVSHKLFAAKERGLVSNVRNEVVDYWDSLPAEIRAQVSGEPESGQHQDWAATDNGHGLRGAEDRDTAARGSHPDGGNRGDDSGVAAGGGSGNGGGPGVETLDCGSIGLSGNSGPVAGDAGLAGDPSCIQTVVDGLSVVEVPVHV